MISSLKQDKELLQHELTKKAELICDFLPGAFIICLVINKYILLLFIGWQNQVSKINSFTNQ